MNVGAFVYNLAQGLSKHHEVVVISAFKISDVFKKKAFYGEERCRVYRPWYLSTGNRKILGVDLERWSFRFRKWAVKMCFLTKVKECDLVYAHFLINALTIDEVARNKKIPLVIASGESSYGYMSIFNPARVGKLVNNTSALLAVSSFNEEHLVKMGFGGGAIQVLPNAVNYQLFRPMDKRQCKERIGMGQSAFVVGFIGHFIPRKGPDRVVEAIRRINDQDIKLVCVGTGMPLERNDFLKVIEPVPNSSLPEIINAFDVFVLPTLSEGHCNVIEEVKACCVPVVSSLGTTVESQIDYRSGILIDPMNIDAIAETIKTLKQNRSKLDEMVRFLNASRGENSLDRRVEKVNRILLEAVESKL